MGALHDGHLSLIERSLAESDITVCSIFVNRKQFNIGADFNNYPRIINKDAALLKKMNCDVLFAPEDSEIYPTQSSVRKISQKQEYEFSIGDLGNTMEGNFRPGHFNGVFTIVKRLFDIVKPDQAYFGEKDYQQLSVIRKMTEDYSLPINIIGCPTIREKDGLAMSSRNLLLSKEERNDASIIYKALQECKKNYKTISIPKLKAVFNEKICSTNNLKTEYFEIADAKTLKTLNRLEDINSAVCCVAVYAGKIRLIDNILLYN